MKQVTLGYCEKGVSLVNQNLKMITNEKGDKPLNLKIKP